MRRSRVSRFAHRLFRRVTAPLCFVHVPQPTLSGASLPNSRQQLDHGVPAQSYCKGGERETKKTEKERPDPTTRHNPSLN